MSTEHNPFAALLDGVPRYSCANAGDMEDDPFGKFVFRSDILSALAAAVPADLAEAGKVRPPFFFDRYINGVRMAEDVCVEREATLESAMRVAARIAAKGPNGEPTVLIYRSTETVTLLARIAAQEAQIKRLEAQIEGQDRAIDDLIGEGSVEGVSDWPELPDLYVTSVRKIDGIFWEVTTCSVPLAIGPEVRLTRAEAAETALAASEAKVAKLVEALETIAEYDTGATAGLAYTARAAITEATQ